MRIRFAKDKEGNVYQYVVSAEQDRQEREIEFVDFSNVTMEEAADTMQKWTTVPFPLEDSPMTKIKMIRTSDGLSEYIPIQICANCQACANIQYCRIRTKCSDSPAW